MAPSPPGRRSVPEQNGHSWAKLRNSVVLPLPDGPVITRLSPGCRVTSSGSTNCRPSGVRTETPFISTRPPSQSSQPSVGSSRPSSLATTRPCRRMMAAR